MLHNTPKLFTDIQPSTAADWKKQLAKDLKDISFDDLIWKNENGFDVAPYYTQEDLKTVYEPAFTHHDWDVCVQSDSHDPAELNRFFLQYLNRGATSIAFHTKGIELKKALKNVGLEFIQASFYCTPACLLKVNHFLEENYDLPKLHISLLPAENESEMEFRAWLNVVKIFSGTGFAKTTTANVLSFHNRSCPAYFEIALALAQLAEYLENNALGLKAVVVKMGVNTDYFVQIAKFRAVRRLWNLLKKEYKIDNGLHLVVENASFNKSVFDPHTNLLRSTVEAMAAVAGGCNELVVNGFDVTRSAKTEFAQRLAVNQQLILKEESYLNKMADVSCGSYYIETLTDRLAERALESFKEIESQGGYFAALKKGFIEKTILTAEKDFIRDLQSGKKVAVGVNKFQGQQNISQATADDNLPTGLLASFEYQQHKNLSNA